VNKAKGGEFMEEKWYPLKNWPGYEISDKQRVRSYLDRRGFGKNKYVDVPEVLDTQTHRLGYKYVHLRRDGRTHKGYIHHLMAETFIPNPENKPEVNHENGNKADNSVGNLTWNTRAENMEHARRTGLWDVEKTMAAARDACRREVYCYEDDKYFHTAADAADFLGVSKSCITLCCQGKSHHVRGKHLCYAEDIEFLCRNIENIRGLERQKKRVRAINVVSGEERVYSSRQDASKDLDIPDSYISNIIAGRSYQTRGWTFEDLPIVLEKR
jgi:hypothetical protein